MYSVAEIRDNYKSFSDAKIERIAINDSKGLRKEVLKILKDEIEKRNLDKNLMGINDKNLTNLIFVHNNQNRSEEEKTRYSKT